MDSDAIQWVIRPTFPLGFVHSVAEDYDDQRAMDSIRNWLEDFSQAVREVDYEAGRRLFAPEAVGFGTVTPMAVGLDALVDRQWMRVWNVTRGFRFDASTLVGAVDGNAAWAVVRWSSEGQRDGGWFTRTGRSSFVFRRDPTGWLAVHSHFSLDPAAAGIA